MSRGRVVALVLVGLIAAGCDGSSPSPKPTATVPAAEPIPEAGQCLAKEVPDLDDFAPDLDSLVDCTEPHIYEVTAVVDVPARLLKGETPQELVAERKKLASLTNDSEAREKFLDYAGASCNAADVAAAGLSAIKLKGKSVAEANASMPLSDASQWLNLLDPGNWAKGNTKFLCTIRYNKHQTGGDGGEGPSEPESIRSTSTKQVVQSYLTKDFPLRHRVCVALDTEGPGEPLSCKNQHHGEMIFVFDARPVFGTKFVQSIGLDEPSAEETKKLSEPCIDVLPSFLGAGYDKDVTVVAKIGEAGWKALGDFYPTFCIVVARDAKLDLPAGSLIDNAKAVDLIPVGQSQVSWLRGRT